MSSYKINSQDERAGRRVLRCPDATTRAPELSDLNNIHLNSCS